MELRLEQAKNEAAIGIEREVVKHGYIQIPKDIYRNLMVDSAIIRQLTMNIDETTADTVAASYVKEVLKNSKDLLTK